MSVQAVQPADTTAQQAAAQREVRRLNRENAEHAATDVEPDAPAAQQAEAPVDVQPSDLDLALAGAILALAGTVIAKGWRTFSLQGFAKAFLRNLADAAARGLTQPKAGP